MGRYRAVRTRYGATIVGTSSHPASRCSPRRLKSDTTNQSNSRHRGDAANTMNFLSFDLEVPQCPEMWFHIMKFDCGVCELAPTYLKIAVFGPEILEQLRLDYGCICSDCTATPNAKRRCVST
eukprot:1566189-Rhodomonas_salina.1